MSTYSESDSIDTLSADQLELMARSECSILVAFLKDGTAFDVHRVRLLLELGSIEAKRRLDALTDTASGRAQRTINKKGD